MTTHHEDQGHSDSDVHDGTSPPAQVGQRAPYQSQSPSNSYIPQQSAPSYVVSVPVKSSGVAVLLSFLWLGAGHLYAGSITAGILLLMLDFTLVLLSLIPFALILTVPIWIVAFIICSISAVQCVEKYNRRLTEVGNLHP